jgi:hypothetical protein
MLLGDLSQQLPVPAPVVKQYGTVTRFVSTTRLKWAGDLKHVARAQLACAALETGKGSKGTRQGSSSTAATLINRRRHLLLWLLQTAVVAAAAA